VLNDFFKCIMAWLRKPGLMYVIQVGSFMSKLIYQVSFPSIVADDTAKRTLTIKESGQPDVVVDITPVDSPSYQFNVTRDSTVTLELVDTDSTGNVSPAQQKVFTAADTVPPPMPGEMNITAVGQTE
jgi:hypothetical protein